MFLLLMNPTYSYVIFSWCLSYVGALMYSVPRGHSIIEMVHATYFQLRDLFLIFIEPDIYTGTLIFFFCVSYACALVHVQRPEVTFH